MATRLDLRAAIKRLTPKQRTALALYLDGHTQAEIGERLGGIKRAAVCRLLQRAYQAIRAEM